MIDILLVLVIIVLTLHNVFCEWQSGKEKSKLIHALISKNPQEFKDLEVTDKLRVKATLPKEDIVSMDQLSDDDFDKMIRKEAEHGK